MLLRFLARSFVAISLPGAGLGAGIGALIGFCIAGPVGAGTGAIIGAVIGGVTPFPFVLASFTFLPQCYQDFLFGDSSIKTNKRPADEKVQKQNSQKEIQKSAKKSTTTLQAPSNPPLPAKNVLTSQNKAIIFKQSNNKNHKNDNALPQRPLHP